MWDLGKGAVVRGRGSTTVVTSGSGGHSDFSSQKLMKLAMHIPRPTHLIHNTGGLTFLPHHRFLQKAVFILLNILVTLHFRGDQSNKMAVWLVLVIILC